MRYQYEWKSPLGDLILGATEESLYLCDWKYRKMRSSIDKRMTQYFLNEPILGENIIIEKTIHEIDLYFQKEIEKFTIPLLMIGTEFQKKVWTELIQISYGVTYSYMDLSKKLGDIKAIRAVATANGANAISILVPCHRVIGTDRSLVGYAGGLQTKKRLLELEAPPVIDLFS